MGKRQRTTSRTPEKEQQAVDNWLPGSGVPPAPEISLPRPFAPPDRTFRDATTDQIKHEMAFQEELLAGLQESFPRVLTGTRSELNAEEEEAENQMEARHRLIQSLKLELSYRGENASSSDVLTRSERVPEEKRSNPGRPAESTEPKSPSASEGIVATATSRPWYESHPDTLRRRQSVLKNPRMPAKSLCNLFDRLVPPIPLPRDWRAELGVKTWSEAYANPTGRNRVQKIISTDKREKKKPGRP